MAPLPQAMESPPKGSRHPDLPLLCSPLGNLSPSLSSTHSSANAHHLLPLPRHSHRAITATNCQLDRGRIQPLESRIDRARCRLLRALPGVCIKGRRHAAPEGARPCPGAISSLQSKFLSTPRALQAPRNAARVPECLEPRRRPMPPPFSFRRPCKIICSSTRKPVPNPALPRM